MNNLVLKEKQEFMGIKIPVIEGGFGEGQRIVLAKTVSEIHNTELKEINRLINRNIERFSENDLLDCLSGSESLRKFARENGLIGSNRTQNVFILSQRGYTKLVAMMDNSNDKKWDVMNNLIDDYFNMKVELKGGQPKSSLDLLELQVKALKEVKNKVEKVDQKFDELPLFKVDAKSLSKLVNSKMTALLGGKKSTAYKTLNKKAFSDLYKQIHREFQVGSIDEIKRKDLDYAKEIVVDYKLPRALREEIESLNNQISFKEEV